MEERATSRRGVAPSRDETILGNPGKLRHGPRMQLRKQERGRSARGADWAKPKVGIVLRKARNVTPGKVASTWAE